MTTILVRGQIPRPLGDRPWGGVRVGWQFIGYTQDGLSQRPSDSGETFTKPDGTWQLDLWPNSLGIYPSKYIISFLNNNFDVVLGAGLPSTVEFSDLILANRPAVEFAEPDLTNLITTIIAAQLPALLSGSISALLPSLVAPAIAQSRVQRITSVAHTFLVGDILHRTATGYELASLTDLTKFDDKIVVAVGTDWLELPIARGLYTVPSHGLGTMGDLLFQSWTVSGKTTTTAPPVGSRQRIMGRVIDVNTIDYNPEYSFREVT
ncbi:MAG: hypothetical protein ACRC62_03555 [Microcoleus sp.]